MDENLKITFHNRKEYEDLDLFNYSEAKKAIYLVGLSRQVMQKRYLIKII